MVPVSGLQESFTDCVHQFLFIFQFGNQITRNRKKNLSFRICLLSKIYPKAFNRFAYPIFSKDSRHYCSQSLYSHLFLRLWVHFFHFFFSCFFFHFAILRNVQFYGAKVQSEENQARKLTLWNPFLFVIWCVWCELRRHDVTWRTQIQTSRVGVGEGGRSGHSHMQTIAYIGFWLWKIVISTHDSCIGRGQTTYR